MFRLNFIFFFFLMLQLFCARANGFKLFHSFLACLARLSIRLYMNFSDPRSACSHTVLQQLKSLIQVKRFISPLKKTLYCLLCSSFVIIFFYRYCKAVLLHDKSTSKLVLLKFLFDLLGYLLNFLTMLDKYRMLKLFIHHPMLARLGTMKIRMLILSDDPFNSSDISLLMK